MKKSFCKVLLSAVFGAIFLAGCVSNKVEGLPEEPKTSSTNYKMISINENLNYLKSQITFPEFENYPDLNKIIRNTVESNWKSFKGYTKTEWVELNNLNSKNGEDVLPPFEYKVISEVTGNSKYISVLINTYIFNGGAHGNTSLIAYNYNIETGKIDNIITASNKTVNEISEICRKVLYERLISKNKNISTPNEEIDLKEMINDGAFPQIGNFQIFTMQKNRMNVYFEPYSVAPYAYGIQKVEINIE